MLHFQLLTSLKPYQKWFEVGPKHWGRLWGPGTGDSGTIDQSGWCPSPVDVLPETCEKLRWSMSNLQGLPEDCCLKNLLMIVETSNKRSMIYMISIFRSGMFLSSRVVGNCFWKPGNPTTHWTSMKKFFPPQPMFSMFMCLPDGYLLHRCSTFKKSNNSEIQLENGSIHRHSALAKVLSGD